MKIAMLYKISKLISVSILIGNPPICYYWVPLQYSIFRKLPFRMWIFPCFQFGVGTNEIIDKNEFLLHQDFLDATYFDWKQNTPNYFKSIFKWRTTFSNLIFFPNILSRDVRVLFSTCLFESIMLCSIHLFWEGDVCKLRRQNFEANL